MSEHRKTLKYNKGKHKTEYNKNKKYKYIKYHLIGHMIFREWLSSLGQHKLCLIPIAKLSPFLLLPLVSRHHKKKKLKI